MALEKLSSNSSGFAFGKNNYKLFILSVIIVLIGYFLMSGGASKDPSVFNEEEVFSNIRITVAPIVLVIGYVLGVYSIFAKPKSEKEEQ